MLQTGGSVATLDGVAPVATTRSRVLNPPVVSIPGPHLSPAAATTPVITTAVNQRVDLVAREVGLIGTDPTWRHVLDLAATVASTRTSVLIVGEPGTGKSLLARLIHALGPAADRPFITVEPSAFVDELTTPQRTEPAYSSAMASGSSPQEWTTKLSQAHGGTLYIDEVSALPLEVQHHLFRELHFRDYEASAGPPRVRRAMPASSCPRAKTFPPLIEQGRFRQELYHRISVISLMLPRFGIAGPTSSSWPNRSERITAREFHKTIVGFTRDALDVLQKHDWPGNVRELEAAVQAGGRPLHGPRITSSHLAPILNHQQQAGNSGGSVPRPHLQMEVRP